MNRGHVDQRSNTHYTGHYAPGSVQFPSSSMLPSPPPRSSFDQQQPSPVGSRSSLDGAGRRSREYLQPAQHHGVRPAQSWYDEPILQQQREREHEYGGDEYDDERRLSPPPSIAPGQDGSRDGTPPPTGPLLDHSHLRPGKQAALLSYERTLELYRANAKKTQDPELQFEFAAFMIDASKSLPIPAPLPNNANILEIEKMTDRRDELIREAIQLLRKLADRGHPGSQYFLADCYSNGIGTPKNKQDFDKAFPLFVLAAKHGHPDAAYRAGTCCENGWGCRRDSAKAITFYRKAAAALHPGALYRLGTAELNGELGMSRRPKEGVKWLKRSAEHATAEFPHALHELALLHERGIDDVLFVDFEYAAELLAQASELGYAPSAYRLGECYEYGKMGCPQDPALSIHYYNIAAQQGHRDACFALTAWYLVGSPGVLPQSDTEAYLWATKAADAGLAKAMYAVGYFSEVGIGTVQSMPEAVSWYKRAAEMGDKRATQRLKASGAPMPLPPNGANVLRRAGPEDDAGSGDGNNKKDCIIM